MRRSDFLAVLHSRTDAGGACIRTRSPVVLRRRAA